MNEISWHHFHPHFLAAYFGEYFISGKCDPRIKTENVGLCNNDGEAHNNVKTLAQQIRRRPHLTSSCLRNIFSNVPARLVAPNLSSYQLFFDNTRKFRKDGRIHLLTLFRTLSEQRLLKNIDSEMISEGIDTIRFLSSLINVRYKDTAIICHSLFFNL